MSLSLTDALGKGSNKRYQGLDQLTSELAEWDAAWVSVYAVAVAELAMSVFSSAGSSECKRDPQHR